MRRRGLGAPLLLPFLILAGCAGSRPCMVIPAQIELARDVRDAARAELEAKKADHQRWVHNVEQSRMKIERLTEERDDLRKQVGDTESLPKEEEKKEEKKQ